MINYPVLKSSRIELVALEREHLKFRVDFINDSDVQSTLNFDYPTSLSKTEAWFSKNCLSSNRFDFTVLDRKTKKVIGFVGFLDINYKASKAEHYIFIGDKNYWSKGFGGETYKLLTNYAFIELGLNRLYGYQLENNVKAEGCIKKIGWTIEGLLRDDIFSHGVIKSRKVISILRSEWEKNNIYREF